MSVVPGRVGNGAVTRLRGGVLLLAARVAAQRAGPHERDCMRGARRRSPGKLASELIYWGTG